MTLVEGSNSPCRICGGHALFYDRVDANKTCEDHKQRVFPVSDTKISYYRCPDCQFCFAPEMYAWSIADFEKKIYNDEYVLADPEYVDVRAKYNAGRLKYLFEAIGAKDTKPRHLDYGGGNGNLSKLLAQEGWDSHSYDPFVDGKVDIRKLGQFDFITAYEVFEHVPDVRELMNDITALLAPEGVLMFSTLVSDGEIHNDKKLDWWYAAPRNGHISLFSKDSLSRLANQLAFKFGSLDKYQHLYWKKAPVWSFPLLVATDTGRPIHESGRQDRLINFLGLTNAA